MRPPQPERGDVMCTLSNTRAAHAVYAQYSEELHNLTGFFQDGYMTLRLRIYGIFVYAVGLKRPECGP